MPSSHHLLFGDAPPPPSQFWKVLQRSSSCHKVYLPLLHQNLGLVSTHAMIRLSHYLGRVSLPLSHPHCCFATSDACCYLFHTFTAVLMGQILIGWLLCGLGPCWHLPAHSSDHSQSEKPFHGYFHVTLLAFITVWSNSPVESNVISSLYQSGCFGVATTFDALILIGIPITHRFCSFRSTNVHHCNDKTTSLQINVTVLL